MTIFPKRVWTKKGMVFHDKKPVRQLGDKVWVYDPNFTEVDSGEVYPEKAWENVPDSEELLIYDWEQPTEIWTFEDAPVSYTLTFIPRDENNNTQWGGSISPTSYTVTQDWLYLWFNNSFTDNLRIVTDPTEATGTTVDMIVPTTDTGYYPDWWYYYNETQQDWIDVYLESGWVLIDRDIQIRWYFSN